MRAGRSIEELYERESARILAMCRAILGDRGDAEDAMQETFARVAARRDTLEGDPAAYLVVVARHVCLDELRRHRRIQAARHSWPPDPAPDDTAVDRSLLRLAWRNLSHVERYLIAGVVNGLSLGEMARHSGVSTDVAAQRISRARRRMRRLVAAPALVLFPLAAAAGRPLRRLGSLPADIAGALAGRAHQGEALAGPLIVGVIAGMLGTPAAGGARPASPPVVSHVPVVAAPSAASASPAANLHARLPGRPLALAPTAVPSPPAPPSLPPLPEHSVFDHTHVTSFTASPSYSDDHTVFATGTCLVTGCNALFRSTDGGRSWTALRGDGLAGGRILLPPDYPRTPLLFSAAQGSGLLRSDDGGATFTAVTAPLSGLAAVDPTSPPGDTRVVLQLNHSTALASYRDSDRSLTPVTGLPTDVASIAALFSAPGADAVYVAIGEVIGGSSLYACNGAASCTRAGPGLTGQPLLSPTFAADHTMFVRQTTAVAISRVDGSGARTVSTGSALAVAAIPAADYATSGHLDILIRRQVDPGGLLAMVTYTLATATTSAPSPTGFTSAMDLDTVARLPDGRILTAITVTPQRYAVRCSTDNGASFTASC